MKRFSLADRSEGQSAGDHAERKPGSRIKRLLLAVAVGVVTINIWTGSPALALWVGSRVQGGGPPKMSSIFTVILVFAALSYALVKLLAILNHAYEQLAGTQRQVRAHAPWLRSMRGERQVYSDERPQFSVIERIVIVITVIAVVLFEIWFFFFSASPIDQRTGRASATPLPLQSTPLKASSTVHRA